MAGSPNTFGHNRCCVTPDWPRTPNAADGARHATLPGGPLLERLRSTLASLEMPLDEEVGAARIETEIIEWRHPWAILDSVALGKPLALCHYL